VTETFAFGQFGDSADFNEAKFLEVLQKDPKNAGVDYKKLLKKVTVKDEKNVTCIYINKCKNNLFF